MYINQNGYLERRTRSGRRATGIKHAATRNWWLVKSDHRILCLNLPSKYIGKRIRLKLTIEEVDGGN